MKCPNCGYKDSKVTDTRTSDEGDSIMRRRQCLECSHKFKTKELAETKPITVIKRDGTPQVFNKDKLLQGMISSCEKRPVEIERLDLAANQIIAKLNSVIEEKITSDTIGELCLEKLREIDQVAYVRFASVYRRFQDVDSFRAELDRLQTQSEKKPEKTGEN